MQENKYEQYKSAIISNFKEKKFVSLRLLDNKSSVDHLKQIIVKPVLLKSGYQLQFIFRHKTKDITKNYTLEESISQIEKFLNESFHQSEMITTDEIHHISRTNKKNWKLKIKIDKNEVKSLNHNKVKNHLISSHAPYLYHLGVTNEKGDIKSSMSSKFKQINRFIEILSSVIDPKHLEEKFSVLDMGSGKGYLSFALYDYLSRNNSDNIKVTGIELRGGLVETCNQTSNICGLDNLTFKEGFIQDYKADNLGMLIALHACNTATDDAIYKGIKSNAKYIICSPCCHKQVRKSMEETKGITSITKYGILKERQAEIITDTIRALILEAFGYKTNVMEFISSEHTAKNLLIVAKKVGSSNVVDEEKVKEIEQLKSIFGIKKHYLQEITKI